MKTDQKLQIALLGLIIFTGFLLRFWDFWNIPFMFDELSAMGRTTYSNFNDLIRYGVVERDSHPAGVQVFLFYWVRFFGDDEYIVKLPFLLCGMLSIWFSFKVGELWFGKTTGLLTAAYVSSLQLFVMYSQIARPYVSGLFLTLVMVFYGSKYFFEKPKTGYLFLFVIFAALASYNHYFSLLFAATVGFSGILLVKRKTLIPYLLSGVAIVLLYIPHLGILFAQAEKGTIGGWLGAPGKYFFVDFFYWLFHDSVFSYGLFLAVLFIGILIGKPQSDELNIRNKTRILMLLWLLPAPIFGYVYSYLKEPILQNSLLIFTTPYLFMLLFSFTGRMGWKKLSIAVILILVVNSLTLIFVRDYYSNFYKQPFRTMAEEANKLEKKYPNEVLIINDYTPYYTEYFFKDDEVKQIPYFTTRNKNISIAEFDSLLSEVPQDIVVTSGLDDQYFQLIKKNFPYWIGYDFGFTFEQYTLSKIKPEGIKLLHNQPVASTNFLNSTGKWKYSDKNILSDSVEKLSAYLFNENVEWGPKCTILLDSLADTPYLIMDIEIDLKSLDAQCEAILVAEIKNGKEQLAWRGFDFSKFKFKKGKKVKFFASLDVQKALNNEMQVEGCEVYVYLWNPKHNSFWVYDFNISSRPGNPFRYSL